jgi:hypothetical protein
MINNTPINSLNAWRVAQHDAELPALPDRLIRALEAHQAAGAHDLAEYRALQGRLPDPACTLLLDLIAEREERNQALLQIVVQRLHDQAVDGPSMHSTDPAVVTTLRALIRDQHEGGRYLRHLARQAPTLSNGIYTTLLETMARDSETHVAMLRFLLRRIEGSRA